jgi:hypothetical protein
VSARQDLHLWSTCPWLTLSFRRSPVNHTRHSTRLGVAVCVRTHIACLQSVHG